MGVNDPALSKRKRIRIGMKYGTTVPEVAFGYRAEIDEMCVLGKAERVFPCVKEAG